MQSYASLTRHLECRLIDKLVDRLIEIKIVVSGSPRRNAGTKRQERSAESLRVNKLPGKICSKSVSKYKVIKKPVGIKHRVAVEKGACRRVVVVEGQFD